MNLFQRQGNLAIYQRDIREMAYTFPGIWDTEADKERFQEAPAGRESEL